MQKVVMAQEMARVEKLAIAGGCNEEAFMRRAGERIAAAVIDLVQEKKLPKKVALLVGKGNNGGDAYAAGLILLEEEYRVWAFSLYQESACGPLNRKFRTEFLHKRGVVTENPQLEEASLILDGLLGTGFKGSPEPEVAQIITAAQQSKKPILAIDIPSGLDGTTGEVRNCAITAEQTVALGAAKSGFFLREGWNRVGRLRVEDFGLPLSFLEQAEPFAFLPEKGELAALLPPLVRTRHKYEAGYVVGFAGSSAFKGAPKMAGLAALRSGAGIVRIFHRGEIGEGPAELIFQPWDVRRWHEELKRAKALFMGPGIGSDKEALRFLKKEFKALDKPCVLDAEALQKGLFFPERAILTPHRGEMLRLLGLKKMPQEEEFLARCQKFCHHQKVILVLKGAPTFIFHKGEAPALIPFGDPGMATAGSGDVLTGVLAALLAQELQPFEAALLGASLHALAGERAAKEKSSYSEIAGDLIEFLPQAFQEVTKWREGLET